MSKRKPWRKFKKERWKREHIRYVCALFIIIELAVLGIQGQLPFPVVEVREGNEVVIYQQSEVKKPMENQDETTPGDPEKDEIYGIRFRLKEGMIDFYRKEELKD